MNPIVDGNDSYEENWQCNNTGGEIGARHPPHPLGEKMLWTVWVGFGIAVLSNFLDGYSIILKKQSLKKLQERGQTRASEGGFGYLKEGRWWLGIIVLGLGELLKFVAYLIAPAILITPLGVLAIVFNATMAPYFLNERIGPLGRVGCFLVIVGCVIVSICGPKDHEIPSLDALDSQLSSTKFILYFTIIMVISIVLIIYGPKYGHRNVFYYSAIITGLASLSVMVCKGIGVGFIEASRGKSILDRWSFWVCCIILVAALVVETIYAQKLLDLFHATLAMSAMYVLINPLIIIVSVAVFGAEVHAKDVVLTILGVIVNVCAVFLLNWDKEFQDDDDTDIKTHDKNSNVECKSRRNSSHISDRRIKKEDHHDISSISSSPKMTPMKGPSSCAMPSLPPAVFRDGRKSVSCLSLISGQSRNMSDSNIADDTSNRSEPVDFLAVETGTLRELHERPKSACNSVHGA